MTWPVYTIAIMVAAVVILIAIDVVLEIRKPDGDTYSEVIREAGRRWQPIIMLACFAFGLLCGHWWW